MNFTPKTEDELNTFEVFPKGEYDFDVVKAADKISSNGNPMIEISISIYAQDGRKNNVFDYLLEIVAYKLKHFCEAVGLSKEYQAGTLTADMCLNRAGKCIIGIQPKKGEYAEKNIVKDYIPLDAAAAALDAFSKREEDIPF